VTALTRPEGVLCDLTFPGDPVVKKRPQVTFKGGHAFAYSPSSAAEKALAQFFRYRHRHPTELEVDVTIGFACATRRACDLDNLVKLVLDAANGILWVDDRQVRRIEAVLQRGVGPKHACTRVEVRELLMESVWPWPRS
jgi:crossover junction endodeoxyribonuclease RusA